MRRSGDYVKGVIGMTVSSVMFSVMATLIRYARDIDFFKTSLYRFVVGAFILATLALFKRIRLDFHNSRVLFFRGFLGGIAVVLFYLAIVKLGIAKGTVISFTYPVFATIGGLIFLKDRVRPLVWLFMLSSLLGILLLTYEGESNLLRIDLWTALAFSGAVIGGLALVCVKRLTQTDSNYSIYMSQCLMGFWLVVVPANLTPAKIGAWGMVILLSIGICATIAQLLMNWGFGRLSIPTGSLLGLVTPVCNVFIGILLFGELLGGVELIGVFLVLASCVAIIWSDRSSSKASP
jgi:drug/metabolite transporter (DMT)-like permease